MKLIPCACVKPFVKRQKNDAADAEAICEAEQRPTMRFVPDYDRLIIDPLSAEEVGKAVPLRDVADAPACFARALGVTCH